MPQGRSPSRLPLRRRPSKPTAAVGATANDPPARRRRRQSGIFGRSRLAFGVSILIGASIVVVSILPHAFLWLWLDHAVVSISSHSPASLFLGGSSSSSLAVARRGNVVGQVASARGVGGGGERGTSSLISSYSWSFSRDTALQVQSRFRNAIGRTSPSLTAYAESMPPSWSHGNRTTTASGPLPLRTQSPSDLIRLTYPHPDLGGGGESKEGGGGCCSNDGAGGYTYFPTGHPPSLDALYGPTSGRLSSLHPHRLRYAQCCCPVDLDPFLPWIHDVFPTSDGTHVELIVSNKRRCRGDVNWHTEDLKNLEGQVSLFQPVPIKRLKEEEARRLAPDLWSPSSSPSSSNIAHDLGNDRNGNIAVNASETISRYRLASFDDADVDSIETRLICRFYTYVPDDDDGDPRLHHERNNDHDDEDRYDGLRQVLLGETLSVYPYNPEFANYRKPSSNPILTPLTPSKGQKAGKDEQIWNSVLHMRCPVPFNIQKLFATGRHVVDGTTSVYLDIIPIRTPARTDRVGYMSPTKYRINEKGTFDPHVEWGRRHVLPRVEASGRWSNVPICRPPMLDIGEENGHGKGVESGVEQKKRKEERKGIQRKERLDSMRGPSQQRTAEETTSAKKKKKHFLIGCVWSSATFTTRGPNAAADTSTPSRLLEFLTYHLYVAQFDHVYVYDNTGAFTNATSLKHVTDLFPSHRVTRIAWDHRVCNNNRPAHADPGERSSQYAAETSCRIRYGPGAEWMAGLDVDEYLIPMGRWHDIKSWLKDGVGGDEKTNILSFYQTRAIPIVERMDPYVAEGSSKCSNPDGLTCLAKRQNATFLETYDCERTPLPKPSFGWRAQKQIYRPEYVLNHFVHYSTVTRRLIDKPNEPSLRFIEKAPFERRVDDLNEAFMLHAKTTSAESTAGWRGRCAKGREGKDCPVGVPFAQDGSGGGGDTNGGPHVQRRSQGVESFSSSLEPNCYTHDRISGAIVDTLRAELRGAMRRKSTFDESG